MTDQTVTSSSSTTSTNRRRQPLITVFATATRSTSTSSTNVIREVAGGTTANICVVCCCCPCVLLEFLVLAVYKVPMSVLRRMWKSQRRKTLIKKLKRKKKVILEEAMDKVNVPNQQRHCQHHPAQHVVGYIDELSDVELKEFEKVKVSIDGSAEAIELDKQMWDRFREAGFGRSPSQKFN